MKPAALLIALALAFNALAQSGPSVIVGRVTSQSKPLNGAAVRIDSDVLQSTRFTRTTTRGTYWAASLPPGTYSITFSHTGTQTITRKAEVRIGETVRVDAELPPSTEGESVTLTTITRSIMERPDIESSLEPAIVDDLPLGRELTSRMILAPGVLGNEIDRSSGNLFVVDGVFQLHRGANVEIEDAIADATAITATTSPEYGRFTGGVVIATTRSGSNDLSLSLRDTLTSRAYGAGEGDIHSRAEATVGGKIIRDALWYFLAGEEGRDAAGGRERSLLAKMNASPGPVVSLTGSLLRAPVPDESRASGDVTVIGSHRALIDGHADTSRVHDVREHHESLIVHSLVPTPWGDHAIVAGGEEFGNERAAFASDSWSDGVRWVLTAAGRFDENRGTSPRAGVAYDVAGDGHSRISATFARYASVTDSSRDAVLAYTQRVLTSGFARVALVRRNYDSGIHYRAIEGELRADYLFLAVGGNASLARGGASGLFWVTATAPALEQHFTLALLERYRRGAATDLSLSYRLSRSRIEPFAKLDLLDLFDHQLTISEDPLAARRALRLSFGARM